MPLELGLHGIKKSFNQEIESSQTKFHRGAVRSGQRIEYEGSIVVLGDVNGDNKKDIILITRCRKKEENGGSKKYKVGDVLFQMEGGFYRDYRISEKINQFILVIFVSIGNNNYGIAIPKGFGLHKKICFVEILSGKVRFVRAAFYCKEIVNITLPQRVRI